MNRILFALAALLALFALPNDSFACGRGHCGCAVSRGCAVAAPAPRVDLRADLAARFAKFRAERAASGAAFRASLAKMFERAPRPAVVAAPARPCTLFSRVQRAVVAPVVAPRRPCTLFTRAARVEAPRPARVALFAGCHHGRRCAR